MKENEWINCIYEGSIYNYKFTAKGLEHAEKLLSPNYEDLEKKAIEIIPKSSITYAKKITNETIFDELKKGNEIIIATSKDNSEKLDTVLKNTEEIKILTQKIDSFNENKMNLLFQNLEEYVEQNQEENFKKIKDFIEELRTKNLPEQKKTITDILSGKASTSIANFATGATTLLPFIFKALTSVVSKIF
jgi:hypothetical protein